MAGKMIASDARRDGRFYRSANRVCSPQEHSLCEHMLSGRPTDSFAYRAGRLCIPIIRVRKVKGHGQTWGKAPYPITGHGKVQK